jgi:predicted flap endonuclease-1-like 5' DNA nuclease
MDFLNNILCNYPLLPWLLPFLSGLAVGWALWGRFKTLVAELEGEKAGLKDRIKGLEGDLSKCRSHTAELDGDLALAKGKLREVELKLTSHNSGSAADSAKTNVNKTDNADTAISSSSGAAAGSSDDTSVGKYAILKSDNLQIIEGVGPKMEEVLKTNGIDNWTELSKQTPGSLRAILDKYGESYRIIDPSTWAKQAKLAVDGNFDELIALQKNLDTGVADANTTTDSKIEKILIKSGIIRAYKQDDLKVIEGIGPKTEKLLQDAGIATWATLAETSTSRIQEVLNAAGSNFRLADATTWPKQAEMLAAGQFKELEEYQEYLYKGKNQE